LFSRQDGEGNALDLALDENENIKFEDCSVVSPNEKTGYGFEPVLCNKWIV
jgi:hypothetical protein